MRKFTVIATLFLLPLFSGCNKAPEAAPMSAEEKAQRDQDAKRDQHLQDVYKAKRAIAQQRELEVAKVLLRKEKGEIRPEEASELLAQVAKKADVANLAIDAGGDPNAPFSLTPIAVAPAPAASAAPAPAAPTPAPEFAPPGVFYLITAARVETASGVIGLTPGTGVKLVRPGVYLSSAGEVELHDDEVTNNMTYARQILAADQSAQVALRAASAALAPPPTDPTAAATASVLSASGSGFGKAEKLDQIKKQLIILESQEANIRAQIQHENSAFHGVNTIHSSDLPNQLRAIEQQVRDLNAQRNLLQAR